VRAETRHQLKTDRFTQATIGVAEATAHWTVEHKSKLILGVVVAVVVAGAVFGSWYYITQQDDKANLELTKAVRTLETPIRQSGSPETPNAPTFGSAQERATAAKAQLQAVIDKYPHTHTADIARYLQGTNAIELGDKALAERELKDVASSHNSDLAALAKLALASFYGSNSRANEAIDLYKGLINKPTTTVSKVTAQMQLADLYESSQKSMEAKQIYEQIVKENPKTEAESLAKEKLASLK
jgi:TolA-binding protein